MSFSRNLIRLMSEQNIMTKTLAADLQVSAVTVQSWKNNSWEPKMAMAIRLAKRLQTTVEKLAE